MNRYQSQITPVRFGVFVDGEIQAAFHEEVTAQGYSRIQYGAKGEVRELSERANKERE